MVTLTCDACSNRLEFYRDPRQYSTASEHGIWEIDEEDLIDEFIPSIEGNSNFKGSPLDRDWSHVQGQGSVVICPRCTDELLERELLETDEDEGG